MDKKICHTEYWIFLLFPYIDFYHTAVLFHNNTVERQGKCHPLVFFDAAVIMGIQIGKTTLLIQWILFDIQPGGINVCTKDCHSVFQWSSADLKQGNHFLHSYRIYLVASLDLFAGCYKICQVLITSLFCHAHCQRHAFPLCLSLIQKFSVFLIQLI